MATDFPLIPEQERPIEAIAEHCLLAAGAGSGKTRVLVERYLHILAAAGWDPRLPARILAVTFTEKAALEMRKRILDRLAEQEAKAQSPEREALLALGREMESAPISTIHGFCSRVLREHAVEAGLDPRFRVPSELELATLRQEVLDALLAEGDADLGLLAATFKLAELLTALESLRTLRRSLGLDPAELAGEAAAGLAARQDEWLRSQLGEALVSGQQALPAALAGLSAQCPGGEHPQPGGRKRLAEAAALLADCELGVPQPELPEALRAALSRLRTQGAGLDECGRLASDYDGLKKQLAELAGLAAAWVAGASTGPAAARFAALRAAAFRLCGRYEAGIKEHMRARAWLDFEDLQLETAALLADHAGVRRRLQELYQHVLVDEFQDTNRLQLTLVRLLVPADTDPSQRALFLVGDERQSIYGFRHADVESFRSERARMAARGESASLEFNHRSHPGLLEFYNAVFPAAEFPPLRSLTELAPEEPPRVLLQLTPCEEGERIEAQRLRAARHLVAALKAARDDGLAVGWPRDARALDWGDIAILVRSGASVRPLVRALVEAGVPYAADAGREYFLRRELQDLEALVAALDDPFDTFTLARGLRGDLVGISRTDLLALLPARGRGRRSGRDRGETLECLEAAAAGLPGLSEDGRQRLAGFLALRRSFAGRLGRLPLAELERALVAATDYDLRAAAEPQALRILRNLRQLGELLGELESGRRLSLHEFVEGMAALREHAPRQQEAWVPEEGGSLLRILTIHGAKGLEFPLVAVFDLDRNLRPGSGGGNLALLHADLPAGPAALLGLRLRDPALPRDEGLADAGHAWIARERRRRDSVEDLRLLYVALTRAQDYLVLAGSLPGPAAGADAAARLACAGAPERNFLGRLQAGLAAAAVAPRSLRIAHAGDGDRLAGPAGARGAERAEPPLPTPDWALLLPAAAPPPLIELSVTSLALLGSCPLRWLLERRLGLGLLFRPDGESWTPAQRPALESEGGGAALGSALHAILERWDFRRPCAEAFALACPAALSPRLRADAEALLTTFFAAKQPWLTRLAEAGDLRREEPYVHALDGVLLRGQIDLVFTWQGQRVLLDWKSDRVSGREHILRRLGHHRFQMLLYALALAAAGEPADQALLVFLRAGEDGGFRQVRLEPFDLEWAVNHARRLAAQAQALSALVDAPSTEALLSAVPRGQDPPCQDCAFRNGPCPRSYRSASHGLRNWPLPDTSSQY